MSNFSYSTGVIQGIHDVHSNERFARYLAASNGSLQGAIDLYIWNTSVSAAFYGPLQAVEVGLRNAIHRELSKLFSANWHDNPNFTGLNAPFLADAIQNVKDDLVKGHKQIATSYIVAGLNFGFWNHLLGAGPNGIFAVKLWNAGLKNAFPRAPTRKHGLIFGEVKQIRDFRNRIAHHEPIYYRNLHREFERIQNVADWMYPDLADWILYHSRCKEIIEHRPYPRLVF